MGGLDSYIVEFYFFQDTVTNVVGGTSELGGGV